MSFFVYLIVFPSLFKGSLQTDLNTKKAQMSTREVFLILFLSLLISWHNKFNAQGFKSKQRNH